jgi:hypothetical protein
MMQDGTLSAVWCPCGRTKRNKVLETLRREPYNWDVPAAMFSRKPKRAAFNRKLILGKFKTEADLLKSLDHLTAKLGLTADDVAERVAVVGAEKVYRALQVSLSRL